MKVYLHHCQLVLNFIKFKIVESKNEENKIRSELIVV